jgi:glutamyl-Q tRNA(Asp) synthetase
MHLPLAVDDRGLKLSKSGNAPAVGNRDGLARYLVSVLEFLGQSPPLELARAPLDQVWEWALGHWRIEGFAGCASRTAPQVAC